MVELKHYGVGLAAIDAMVFAQVVKDLLSLLVFQPLIKAPQLFPVMLQVIRVTALVRRVHAVPAARRMAVPILASDGECFKRFYLVAERAPL